jgi:threonine dehydrogenase-like Zn-dependent dehydrogenase
MALSQVAAKVEQFLGHNDNATTAQDITNPARDRSKYGHPTETMKALAWMGKNKVEVIEVPKPIIVEDDDVILKITGSTVCGSDLHLLHGTIVELEKGDILGHEFCGIVDDMGPGVKGLSKGQRVVASFQIACGACRYCDKKLSSQCERTNSNKIEKGMYGGNTAGMFGYSHFTGGFAGGQSEYTRVPYGSVNLLPIPDDVPDEKALYLSDVIATSWNCVVDTGCKEGDVVAVWGAGPIGQMAAEFAFLNGASRVIVIDSNWRLDYVKSKIPKVETLDFSQLKGTKAVVWKLKEMTDGMGPDVALECVAGEFGTEMTLHESSASAPSPLTVTILPHRRISQRLGPHHRNGHRPRNRHERDPERNDRKRQKLRPRGHHRRLRRLVCPSSSSSSSSSTSSFQNPIKISLRTRQTLTHSLYQQHEPLQHRLPHGTRHPLHRQRPSPRPLLLGRPSPEDSRGRN